MLEDAWSSGVEMGFVDGRQTGGRQMGAALGIKGQLGARRQLVLVEHLGRLLTEPGEVQVTIGANSTTGGTPQNDSLQVWKDQLMRYHVAYNRLRLQATPGASDSLMARGREIQQALRNYIKVFKARQPEGELKNFLVKMYPTL